MKRIIRWAASWAGIIWLLAAAIRSGRRRRGDREWAAGIAGRVHDRAYLEWLESEFGAMDAGERP